MKTRQIISIVEKGRKLRLKKRSWSAIAKRLEIYNKNGELDPALAYRIIVDGYEPKGIEIRNRLNLAPVCPDCHQKIPRVVEPWVSEAVDNLERLREIKISSS